MTNIREFVTPANGLTSASLVAGFLGLVAIVDAHLLWAAGWMALAALLDSLDGVVARRRGGDRAFGANLDSLADLVCFGVLPALALYLGPLRSLSVLGVAVSAVFVLAAAWRLARFPLVKRCDFFLGLPIPVAGVLLMAVLLSGPTLGVAVILPVALSGLMVSTLPFPTLHTIGRGTTAGLRGTSRGRFRRR